MTSVANLVATLREWSTRIWGSLRRGRSDSDLEAELKVHLELAAEAARRGDEGPAAARAEAIRWAGVAQTMEVLRDQRGFAWFDDLQRDARHALRQLRRTPVFTSVAVLSLALGIGATTAIFSLADAIILRPLPVGDPGSIVTVSIPAPSDSSFVSGRVSYANFRDLRERSRSFDGLIAYQRFTSSFARSPQAAREMRLGVLVSDGFFDVLGVQPALGRGFAADEGTVAGRDAVVVLGYDFWKNALSADASILDSVVQINQIDFTVIGVAPERFTGLDPIFRPAFYVPAMMAERLATEGERSLIDRSLRSFAVKGRLKSGASRQAARGELAAIWQGLEEQYPDANRNRTVAVLTELQARAQTDPINAVAMAMLLALVAIVLVIACANIANLMLGRSRGRLRETAIRLALGVGRGRLFRQLVTESLLLATIGCALGLAFAYQGVGVFRTFQAPTDDLPVVIAPAIDLRALIFTVLMALVSTLLFGVAPAWQSVKTELVSALRSGEPGETQRHRTVGRNVLVVAQVALSMVLLISAGRLLDGFRRSLVTDPGFRTDHLAMMSFDTSFARYTPLQMHEFYRTLVARARALPGVVSVTLTSVVPLDRGGSIEAVIPDGYQFPQGQQAASVFAAVVDESYFGTMKTAIVRGRPFTEADTDNSRRVIIVNEEFAKKYWPGGDPIGKRVRKGGTSGPWLEVVGVARTTKYLFVGEAPMRFVYFPFGQNPRPQMSLIVETASADAASVVPLLRHLVGSLDVNQPVFDVRVFSTFYHHRAIAVPWRIVQMVGSMGVIGLVLALVGLYGLVAYSVGRRIREIGIRVAIGASRCDVVKMVLHQGFTLSIAGIGVGAIASVVVVRVLPAIVLGSGGVNTLVYVIVPVGLIGLTMIASYFPARRAAAINPVEALKVE